MDSKEPKEKHVICKFTIRAHNLARSTRVFKWWPPRRDHFYQCRQGSVYATCIKHGQLGDNDEDTDQLPPRTAKSPCATQERQGDPQAGPTDAALQTQQRGLQFQNVPADLDRLLQLHKVVYQAEPEDWHLVDRALQDEGGSDHNQYFPHHRPLKALHDSDWHDHRPIQKCRILQADTSILQLHLLPAQGLV